ncbi:hypothetical protein GU3_06680 [Oceanimonas sp. GK1]|uniref:anti-virulence regulator CigR family protein n=1 Tax=Oceanimonas sp. (strain GK1 / IBRC-M 10197) TaxID=511062 RepID=UPI0002495573|nr:anti-virulence regulator CigR family protein [Oceanimonas sp. GK1]AEY01092.1 hypothetical protein GU3_06680 [Oceanimonas sp. GK1]
MHKRTLIASLLLAGLALPVQAQPPEGRGPGQAPGRQQEQQWQREDGRHDNEWREHRNERREDRYQREHHYDREPRVDERQLRRLFREHRDWLEYDGGRRQLPPGIAKNLRRGKPLPPGIAKQFDPRFRERLPYYEGYEWRRVDNKAVLVDLATENVRYILEDILN